MGLNPALGPSQINYQPAPGIPGDFASANTNRFSVLAGAGALVAGAAGVTVGLFAWIQGNYVDDMNAPALVNNFGLGLPTGFVNRNQQGLITTFLSNASNVIPPGFPVTLHNDGDFFVANAGSNQAQVGMKAYANLATGAVTFNWTATPTTASATTSAIAAGTAATFTGSIAGNVLMTSGVVTNTIFPGAVLTGGTVATGTTILGQLSGVTGGAGTYAVSIPEQTVASAALTATPYVLDTTGGSVTGTIGVGAVVTADTGSITATAPAAVLGAAVTAAYATGKWVLNTLGATATSGTVTLETNIETKWICRSSGAAGETVKMGASV